MDEPCDVCGAGDPMRPDLDVSLGGVVAVSVRACVACGFRQVRPRLARAELAGLYPDRYFDSGSALGFRDYARVQQRHERQAFFLARRLNRTARSGRLLEVGSALGFLLEALRRFTTWEVTGLDISPFAAYFARRRFGLDVTCGTLEEAGFPDGAFDAVVQKDLLERVPRPREHLGETRRILRPGGLVWLITPNGEANLRPLRRLTRALRRRGDDALPVLAQGHLSFFSRLHLLRLFAECGFECIRMRNLGVRQGLRALGWLPGKPGRAATAPPARDPSAGRGAIAGAPDPEGEASYPRVYEGVAREVEAARRAIRSRVPYFYFRQGLKRLDTAPGFITVGHDFEFLLRRR